MRRIIFFSPFSFRCWPNKGFTFPSEAGYPMNRAGGAKFFMLETHYDNPNLQSGIVDHSGLRLFYTSQLRYDWHSFILFFICLPSYFVESDEQFIFRHQTKILKYQANTDTQQKHPRKTKSGVVFFFVFKKIIFSIGHQRIKTKESERQLACPLFILFYILPHSVVGQMRREEGKIKKKVLLLFFCWSTLNHFIRPECFWSLLFYLTLLYCRHSI